LSHKDAIAERIAAALAAPHGSVQWRRPRSFFDGHGLLISRAADAIALWGCGDARVFMSLAAMDIGTAFTLGAARDMVVRRAALLIAFVVVIPSRHCP
jgi:hypothetical protein